MLSVLSRFIGHRVVISTLEGLLVHLELAEISLGALLSLSCHLGLVDGVDSPENGQFSCGWLESTHKLRLVLGRAKKGLHNV